MPILIVEDERMLRNTVADYLSKNGFDVDTASTLKIAEEKCINNKYNCILVDIGLPDGNGLTLIEKIKKDNPQTGIIIISAKNSIEDRVDGLQIGADDYLVKPFHLSELGARINALVRRKTFGGKKDIVFDNIVIKTIERQVYVNDVLVQLTKKEYDILIYMASNPTHLITKEAFADNIWGDKADMAVSFDFIYSQIKNLKRKIHEAGATQYIKTVYGMGYKFM